MKGEKNGFTRLSLFLIRSNIASLEDGMVKWRKRGAKVKRSKTLLVGLELEWVRVDDRWLFKVESKGSYVDRNEDIGNGRRVGESC